MPTKFTTRVAFAAVLAIALSGSSLALAGGTNTVVIDSEIVMRKTFPAFHGKVKSSNPACVQPRLVKLFKKKRTGGRKLLGEDHTDSAGRWEIIVDPLKSGLYRSVVKQREEGAAGTIFVCARDKSRRIFVD